jgi:signal peptidase II
MPTANLRASILFVSLLLVGCDHYTKHVAKAGLENHPPRPLAAGILDLSYTENTDSGFGLLHAVPESVRKPVLMATQLVGGVLFLVFALAKHRHWVVRLAFLLLSAGAIGNGIDRLMRGYVVDFIHLHHWPVFNVADVYITLGAGLLIVAGRFAKGRDATSLPQESQAGGKG